MPSINVDGAAGRLLAFGTNTPGYCLQFVWRAISQGRVHYITGGTDTAYNTWLATPPASRHNGDRNVPKDMPAYFGPRPGNDKGDVILSNGDGTFTATDRPTGTVGVCTLDERAAQIGRPYLGWAETMGGYTLTRTSSASSGPITSIAETPPKFEDTMYLIRSTSYAADIIVRNDGYMTVVKAPDATNQVSALLSIPIVSNDEYLNSTLTLLGAPDFGTMLASPGKWFSPIGHTAA